MNGQPPTLRYRWQAGADDDHPDCVALDGVTRPLGAWQNSRMPGFHPGCRATLRPSETDGAVTVSVHPPVFEPPLRSLNYRLRSGRIVAAGHNAPPSAELPSVHHRFGRN